MLALDWFVPGLVLIASALLSYFVRDFPFWIMVVEIGAGTVMILISIVLHYGRKWTMVQDPEME